MRYLRCKCGKYEAWTTDDEIPCQGCPECNTTVVGHPDRHKTPEPHTPRMRYSSSTGKPERMYCVRCHIALPMIEELPIQS